MFLHSQKLIEHVHHHERLTIWFWDKYVNEFVKV